MAHTVCSSSHTTFMEAWNDADWTFKQNFLFPFRTAEMLKVSVLQLFCFIKFYRVRQLYCDKHLTLMMFNKCTWYICTRECLNRKRPHPSWKQHYRNMLLCKIQLMLHNEMLLADILMHNAHKHHTMCYILNSHANVYISKWQQRVSTALPCPETQSEGVVDVPACSERGALRFWAGG